MSVSFEWPEHLAGESTLWIWARVEARADPHVPGRILASAGPEALEPGGALSLVLADVLNGSDRVVVLEVRREADTSLPVVSYGISEPFRLGPGVRASGAVRVPLVAPQVALPAGPAEDGAPRPVELRFGEPGKTEALGRVGVPAIEAAVVRLTSAGAVGVTLASNTSFTVNERTVRFSETDDGVSCTELGSATTATAWEVCDLPGWDLTAGLSDVEDGPYSVYVRFIDAYGYPVATVEQASVVLDTRPPALLGTPVFQRADGYERARMDLHDVQARPGDLVHISFVVDEPLRADPEASVPIYVDGVESESATPVEPGRTQIEADVTCDPVDPWPDGEAVVTTVVTDVAGNTSEALRLGTIRFDHTPPAGLAPDRQAFVRLFRAPWGCAETRGAPRVELRVCPTPPGAPSPWDWCPPGAAFEPGGLLTVFATRPEGEAWTCTDEEVAAGTMDAGSGGGAIRIRSDWPAVCVAETDRAGNTSEKALVEQVEWVATITGKVPGSLFENPNSYQARPWFSGALQQPWAREAGGGDGPAAVEGPSFVTKGAGRWWRRGLPDPAARSGHAMAYDSTGGRVVVFAGTDGLDYYSDLWAWDGEEWQDQVGEGAGSETPRWITGHSMAFDHRRGRLVLVGGTSFPPGEGGIRRAVANEDTWEWDGQGWRRAIEGDPEGDGSPSSQHLQVAYDSVHARILAVAVAEREGQAVATEVWEWDGASWSQPASADPEGDGDPPAREGGSLAYDARRGLLVLFGGRGLADDEPLGDTWELSGGSWTNRSAGLPGGDGDPGARRCHALAYDRARGKTILFGGEAARGDTETWEWDGSSWARVTPEDPEGDGDPAARCGHTMAYDPVRERTLLFGGDVLVGPQERAPSQETWEWNGVSWSRVGPSDPEDDGDPHPRAEHALAFDAARRRVVLVGGARASCLDPDGGSEADLWTWDGTSWARVEPEDPEADGSPAPRFGHSLAYDAQRRETVLFGGEGHLCRQDEYPFHGDTWTWNGASWTLRGDGEPEAAASPSGRAGHGLAFDAMRGRTVLFGGETRQEALPETWEWDGASWLGVESLDPEGDGDPTGARFAMAFDGQGVLLRQTRPPLGVSWHWDGVSWALVSREDDGEEPRPAPSARPAYDTSRRRVVQAGEVADGGRCAAWEWSEGGWTLATDLSPEAPATPGAREEHAVAFDAPRGRLVVFGGKERGEDLGDTWEWDGGSEARPGQSLHVAFGAAGLLVEPTWEAVTASFVAGGVGFPDGAERAGADLRVWDEGVWRTVDGNDRGPADPGSLAWTTTDPFVIRRLFVGRERTLSLAVTPTVPNGTGTGEVAVDYAEARVRYGLGR